MANNAPTRLTPRAGRRFAFTLALGFGVLAALFWWREHLWPMRVAGVVAALALLGGLTIPARLGPVERAWTALGVALGRVVAPVFIAAVYWLVITPVGLVRRTFGRSPLRRDPGAPTFWHERVPDTRDPKDRMRRQY